MTRRWIERLSFIGLLVFVGDCEEQQKDCSRTPECLSAGKCSFGENKECVVGSTSDCSRSKACLKQGKCSFSPLLGECEVSARAKVLKGLSNIKDNTELVKQNDLMVRTRVIEIIGNNMVTVKPGTLSFGAHRIPDMPAKPGIDVAISQAFEIAQTEVTQELYELVTGRNPSERRQLDLPVHSVRFSQAIHFLNLLSEVFDLRPAYFRDERREAWIWDTSANGFRLPTETEWEYAARAEADYFYAGSNDAKEVGACGRLQPVRTKKPNSWGIYDLTCNAAELTWAVKPAGIDAYSLHQRTKIQHLITRNQDVITKGRFLGECKNCGSGAIYDVQFLAQTKGVVKKGIFVGFRLARTLPASEEEKKAGKLLPEDASCREKPACGESGHCRFSAGKCTASQAWMCLQSQDCRGRGRCSNFEGECVATTLAKCRESQMCETDCLCELDQNAGTCVARSETCCENRIQCKDEGLCSVDEKSGACVAKRDSDCLPSTVCSRDGRCKAKRNMCVVTDESCRAQPTCLTDGLCSEVDGTCQAQDCRAPFTNVCRFYGRCTVEQYRCVAIASSQCKKADVCLLYGQCERGPNGSCQEPKLGIPEEMITPKKYCAHGVRVFADEYFRRRKAAATKYEKSRFSRECITQIKARLSRKNRNVFTRVGRCAMEAQTQSGIDACARNTAFDW